MGRGGSVTQMRGVIFGLHKVSCINNKPLTPRDLERLIAMRWEWPLVREPNYNHRDLEYPYKTYQLVVDWKNNYYTATFLLSLAWHEGAGSIEGVNTPEVAEEIFHNTLRTNALSTETRWHLIHSNVNDLRFDFEHGRILESEIHPTSTLKSVVVYCNDNNMRVVNPWKLREKYVEFSNLWWVWHEARKKWSIRTFGGNTLVP